MVGNLSPARTLLHRGAVKVSTVLLFTSPSNQEPGAYPAASDTQLMGREVRAALLGPGPPLAQGAWFGQPPRLYFVGHLHCFLSPKKQPWLYNRLQESSQQSWFSFKESHFKQRLSCLIFLFHNCPWKRATFDFTEVNWLSSACWHHLHQASAKTAHQVEMMGPDQFISF